MTRILSRSRVSGETGAVQISQREFTPTGWADPLSTAPTVLFIRGGSIRKFLSATADGAGYASLQDQLYQKGARIIEVAFHCGTGPTVPEYEHSEGLQYNRLNNVLKILKDKDIIRKSDGMNMGEKWWPGVVNNRYAIGESAGQIQLQYAIERHTDDWGKMNRVVYGGGGVYYELFERINCQNPHDEFSCDGPKNYGCDVLNALDYLFLDGADLVDSCGGCWDTSDGSGEDSGVCEDFNGITRPENCYGTGSFNPQLECTDGIIQTVLEDASISTYVGGVGNDDGARIIGTVLQNTGFDFAINRLANNDLIEKRDGSPTGTTKATWDIGDCVCGCAFYGHGLVNRMYALFKTGTAGNQVGNPASVEDWVEFFQSGDTTFDFFEDNGDDSMTNPPTEAECGAVSTYNVGVVNCAASQGGLTSEYSPAACPVP